MSRLVSILLLVLAATAQGTVTVSGAVTAQQAPVAEATVWWIQDHEVTKTATNAEGKFSLDAAIGPLEVVVWKDGFALNGFHGLVSKALDLTLSLAPATATPLRLIGPTFLPVPGARVDRLLINDQVMVAVEELLPHGFPPLRSNDDGLLTIPSLPPRGFLKFVIAHPDFADTSVPYLPVREKQQDIILEKGVTLRGRVTHEGKGIAGARVSVVRPTPSGQANLAEEDTDTEGFYVARIPAGEYLVLARHPEWAGPAPVYAAIPEGGDHIVDLAMQPARRIEGRVVGPGGKGFPAVQLVYRVGPVLYDQTFTDPKGAFTLPVAAAEGLMRVLPPQGYMTADLPDIPVRMGEKTRAKIDAIKLKALPELTGTVVDSEGKPAAQVLVETLNLPDPMWMLTDAEGRFSARLDYMPEQKTLKLRAEHALRFLRSDFEVSLDKSEPEKVKLKQYKSKEQEREAGPGMQDLAALVGKPAPAVECAEWYNGQAQTLADLKDKVVILHFWGGFDDGPAGISRLNEIRAVYALYKDVPDVRLIGIHDASSDPDEVEDYLVKYGVLFPVGRDADPYVSFTRYGITIIPQTVLIGKDGLVREFQTQGRLLEEIKRLRRE